MIIKWGKYLSDMKAYLELLWFFLILYSVVPL